jgi:hypothetical protein
VTLTRGSIHPTQQRSSMAGPDKSDVVVDVDSSSEFNSISFKQLDMGAYEGSPAERVKASISQNGCAWTDMGVLVFTTPTDPCTHRPARTTHVCVLHAPSLCSCGGSTDRLWTTARSPRSQLKLTRQPGF